MRKILVLGGTQFFGKRLVHKLIENGDKVTVATRGITKDSFGNQVDRMKIDREKKDTMIEAFRGKDWDVVYDQSCYSPQEMADALEALSRTKAKYIFTSSMAVYGFGTMKVEEDFDSMDFSYNFKTRKEYLGYEGYQEAKRAAESVLFNKKSGAVAVRFPIVIGKDDFTGRLEFHVRRVMTEKPIGISHPSARYSFILSEEAAEFLFKIGQTEFTGPINPGCEKDIALNELLELIAKEVGKEPLITNEVTKDNTSPYNLPGSWSIDTKKAKDLGFHFSSLEEALKELVQYYIK